MSLNKIQFQPNQTDPVLYSEEKIFLSQDSVSFEYESGGGFPDLKVVKGWISGGSVSGSLRAVQDEGLILEWGNLKLGFSKDALDFKNYFDHLRSNLGTLPATYVEPLPLYDTIPLESSSGAQVQEDLPPPSYE
ncbi:hypothetical protein HDV04_004279 [Boothiomyces sp. JEL0838]|nr:hypothetical protein HDV04_004279 [Boothiomyces sp. JEL0838]